MRGCFLEREGANLMRGCLLNRECCLDRGYNERVLSGQRVLM